MESPDTDLWALFHSARSRCHSAADLDAIEVRLALGTIVSAAELAHVMRAAGEGEPGGRRMVRQATAAARNKVVDDNQARLKAELEQLKATVASLRAEVAASRG